MNVVTLEVGSRDKSNERFLSALKGEAQGAFISFESPAVLFKLFSGKRWDLLKVMAGAGPMTVRSGAPGRQGRQGGSRRHTVSSQSGNPRKNR